MRSNDALVILDRAKGKFLFIEFKNGDIHSTHKKEEIRSKIAESLLILNDIIHEDLTFDRNNINYIRYAFKHRRVFVRSQCFFFYGQASHRVFFAK